MASSWRTINIFLSSTFNDMQGERDAIRKLVVPRLNEALKSRNISVTITDLRWGIDTSHGDEALRESKVLHVCLDAIRNTRPYFIALIGERYGWVPSRERFEQIVNRLSVPDGDVFASIDSPYSVTEMEIILGAIGSGELIDHSCFCFRRPESYAGMSAAEYDAVVVGDGAAPGTDARLKALKDKVRNMCVATGNERSVVDYECRWNAHTQSFEDFAEFARSLEERLLEDIIGEDDVRHEREVYEDAAIDSFMAECAHGFVGRARLLDNLLCVTRHCAGNVSATLNGVILSGPSGVGKSYVLSALATRLGNLGYERLVVLTHVAGLTPQSVRVRDMYLRWERQLRSVLHVQDDYDGNFTKLAEKAVGEGYGVVALIDSMDSFTIGEDPLAEMPSCVFVVATSVPDVADDLMRHHQAYALFDVDVFSRDDATELIDAALHANFKELPDDVRDALLDRVTDTGVPAYASPLWLNLALTMLMEIGADDFRQIHEISPDAGCGIRQYLGAMIEAFPAEPEALFMHMIDMSCKYFDPQLTVGALTYMAVSPFGIEERRLEKLLGDRWDALEFESLRYWMGSLVRMVGEDRTLKLSHSLLTEAALSSSNGPVVEARRKLSELDYADYSDGRASLAGTVRRMIYRSDVQGLRRVVDACGECLCNKGIYDFAQAVYLVLENDVYTVMHLIDRYFQEIRDCDIYDYAKCWITDLADIVNRSDLPNKKQLCDEFEAVQTRYTGAETLFDGNLWNLKTYLSSEANYAARMWVFNANMRLYGPRVLCASSLFWIFSTLESELWSVLRKAREDETLTGLFVRKLNEYVDLAVSLTGQVYGGNAAIRKALADLAACLGAPGVKWDVNTYMEISAMVHERYLAMWPKFAKDYELNEYAWGADSLICAYRKGCPWVEHPVTPLMECFDGRNPVKRPSATMPEVTDKPPLLRPSAADVAKTVSCFKEAFPATGAREVEKIKVGVRQHLANAELRFILGDRDGAMECVGRCDEDDRYSGVVCGWMSVHFPDDAVTREMFMQRVNGELQGILMGKDVDYKVIAEMAGLYESAGLKADAEALLLRVSEFMLLYQVDAKFLYDDESYERGYYTNLDGLFEPYEDVVASLLRMGCESAAVTALRRWLDMCDMTYIDYPKEGWKHYTWAETQLVKLGCPVPERKCANNGVGDGFRERVKSVIFEGDGQDLGIFDGVRHIEATAGGSLMLVSYSHHNTAYTAIFSPSAGLVSELDSYKYIIGFGDNDITFAGETGRWSFIRRNGKAAFDGWFRSVRPFHQGRAAVAVKQRCSFPFRFYWGYVDDHGNEVVPMIYEEAGDFHCGRAWVVSGGLYGAIDLDGKVIVECEYDHMTSFYQGYAYASRGRELSRIGVDGSVERVW